MKIVDSKYYEQNFGSPIRFKGGVPYIFQFVIEILLYPGIIQIPRACISRKIIHRCGGRHPRSIVLGSNLGKKIMKNLFEKCKRN